MEIVCPKCREKAPWEKNPFRPFCSKECKDRDLGSWANEEYRIAEEETTSETPTTPHDSKKQK